MPFLILALFAAIYIIHALSPEIQSDANVYHLKPAFDMVRHGRFNPEIGFYERMPHGVELLYIPAYALAGTRGARLLHLAFLFLSVPLILRIARRLELPGWAGPAAAVLYFCAPVTGTAATAAFNDAALVFCVLLTFWLLLAWWERPDLRSVTLLAVVAGLCFWVKFTGAAFVAAAGLAVLASRRWRHVAVFTCVAAAVMSPWLIRNAIATGNPLAPFFNSWFPNLYFHEGMEALLREKLRNYGVPPWGIPLELTTFGVRLQGLIGPVFLLAPLGLLALRRRLGWVLWVASCAAAIPWAFNAGARFFMPVLPFLALALAASLPKPAAYTLIAVHAVLSVPAVVALYAPSAWRLPELPWRVALHLELGAEYLQRESPEYRVARMVERHADRSARVFDLTGVHGSYAHNDLFNYWHSAKGQRLLEGLEIAMRPPQTALTRVSGRFSTRTVRAIRVRLASFAGGAWSIPEVTLFDQGKPQTPSQRWRIRASGNIWEGPLAFDGSLAAGWRPRSRPHRGMFLEVEFDVPRSIDGVDVYGLSLDQAVTEVLLRDAGDSWSVLPMDYTQAPALNLRKEATGMVKRAGFDYIVVPVERSSLEGLGKSMALNPTDWGLSTAGREGTTCLLRIVE